MNAIKLYLSLALCLILSEAVAAPAGDFLSLTHSADSCYMAGDYTGASAFFAEALKRPEACAANYYNAACCAVKAGETDTAFSRLNRLMQQFPDWYSRRIDTDADLLSLHSDPRWEPFATACKERQTRIESAYEHPLYEQLHAIWNEDQSIRQRYVQAYYANAPEKDSLNREMLRLDTLHMHFVDSLYAARGWLGKKEIGDATSAIWVVVQHYGMDKWQQYLPVFRQAAAQGDLTPHQVTLLEQRIQQYSK